MNSKPNNNLDPSDPLNDTDILLIGSGFKLVGQVYGHGLCIIDGSFEGSIESSSLRINAGGILTGDIKCGKLDLDGRVLGSVEASHVMLRAHATIEGSVLYNTISMASGAIIDGEIHCIKLRDADPSIKEVFVEFSSNIMNIMQATLAIKWGLPNGEPLPDWIKIEQKGFRINAVKLSEYKEKNGQLVISLLAGDEVTLVYFN
jgi:cytoskeletal protein CcmA (bactofilin family)